ncbi:periplasmic heavy metal sensor [Thiocapsa rosea]|uniref:Spy/CpxP family protein refolding chaperone n=1 Tax=Thiocapsa rosea TaxID=69360 RepID=A0A495V6A2_9GAMM|nr:periplasmic heavy metal sensor [Thiocapsa rosea]RKT44912.1 Spy/CpxP family protein refolding chaperone [Thiocapsa rosea]
MRIRSTPLLALPLLLTIGTTQAEPTASPGPASKRPGFLVSELVTLPHPMRLIRENPQRFGVSPEQMESLRREVMDVYPPQLHERVQAAWSLERAIRRAVLEQGKDSAAVAEQLDELVQLKREATDIRIEALNRFRAILKPEQFHAVMTASAEAQ